VSITNVSQKGKKMTRELQLSEEEIRPRRTAAQLSREVLDHLSAAQDAWEELGTLPAWEVLDTLTLSDFRDHLAHVVAIEDAAKKLLEGASWRKNNVPSAVQELLAPPELPVAEDSAAAN
jgi:hypothetical protein